MAQTDYPLNSLRQRLQGTLVDNPRSRRYQEGLDWFVDDLRRNGDPARGLADARNAPALPHQTVPGYWRLSDAQRRAVTPPEAQKVYARNLHRTGTSSLCQAAFCWRSPFSRHHADPEMLRFFENGLRFHLELIEDDGMTPADHSGEAWSQGWDVEGLIYGLMLCEEAVSPDLLRDARERFARAAGRFSRLDRTPAAFGSVGNQRAVYILGLHLYGQFLQAPELCRLSDALWEQTMPLILDDSGQVIEQIGPCMHYSCTAFIYAWLNLVVRGDRAEEERVLRCLNWFRNRHTESLYPIPGPSARKYYETAAAVHSDLWPASEQLAHRDASLREFVDRLMVRCLRPAGPISGALDDPAILRQASPHGASTLMWAILMVQPDSKATSIPPARSVTELCIATQLHKRAPLRYALVRRDYQTHFNCTDFLPFSGIQTWALGDEPPLIHPTPMAPSTTVALGIDTARQGVSHNWGLFGAGALGIDGVFRTPTDDRELFLLVARYTTLWRVVVFTDRSTVLLEFGRCGPRTTTWTLNRLEPAEPSLGAPTVKFAGRRACLHSTVTAPPKLLAMTESDPWAEGVRQLVYECGDSPAVFAFSDDSFQFEKPFVLEDRQLHFADAAGRYTLTLDPRFLQDNPGNIRIDTWQLAQGTLARRL